MGFSDDCAECTAPVRVGQMYRVVGTRSMLRHEHCLTCRQPGIHAHVMRDQARHVCCARCCATTMGGA